MKKIIKKIPLLGKVAIALKNKLRPSKPFTSSEEYWVNRYKKGGDSGAGSYNNLAVFKGEIINQFIAQNNIQTVIELGCGDGNQLKYLKAPSYIGFDISPDIIEHCKNTFKNDPSKQFFHMNDISDQKAELVLSLDVIYHLVEDHIYHQYMQQLFDLSQQYVIIYAYNKEDQQHFAPHVKARKFTDWIEKNQKDYTLVQHIPNKFPYQEGQGDTTSLADFYIFTSPSPP